jgi:hypothetical protein
MFFKAQAKRPYLNHTGRASNAEKQPTVDVITRFSPRFKRLKPGRQGKGDRLVNDVYPDRAGQKDEERISPRLIDTLFRRFSSRCQAPGKSIVALTTQNDEGVVIAIHRPWTWRHFAEFGEFPVAGILVAETQIITNGW